jgi:hypothetical protein
MSRWESAVTLLVLCLAAYSNSFQAGFTFDSNPLVLRDARVQKLSRANLAAIAEKDYWYGHAWAGLYRPVTTLSWLFNFSVLDNRDQPLGYHCVNFALHAASTLFLWALALGIFRRPLPAFFAAAIFAVHPVGTEAVTNISGRSDVLAGAGLFGGLLLYARWSEGGRLGRMGLSTLLFLISLTGMFSKESVIVLLPAMALYDFSFRPDVLRNWRKAVAPYAATAAAIVVALAVRHNVIAKMTAFEFPFLDNPISDAGFCSGRLTALSVIVRYWQLLIWPQTLSADYSYNQIPIVPISTGLGAAAVVLAVLAGLLACRVKMPPVFFGGLLFFVILAPVSNVLMPIGSIMALRFLYLPLAGFAMCCAGLLNWLTDRFPIRLLAIVITATIPISLAARTYVRNKDLQDDFGVWSTAAAASPNSFRAHQAFAAVLMGRDLPGAIEEASKAVSIIGDVDVQRSSTLPYGLLGRMWLTQGDTLARKQGGVGLPPEAEAAYHSAINVMRQGIPVDRAFSERWRQKELARGWSPDRIPDLGNAQLYDDIGEALGRLGRMPDALGYKMQSLHVAPAAGGVRGEVADVLRAMGRDQEALEFAAQAFLLNKRPEDLTRFVSCYRAVYPAACPLSTGNAEDVLDMDCPIVHAVVCRAEAALLQSYRDAGSPDLVTDYRAGSLTGTRCSASGH